MGTLRLWIFYPESRGVALDMNFVVKRGYSMKKLDLSLVIRRDMVISMTVLLFLFILSLSAHAYRPLGTEDAGVGAMGEIALELSYDHTVVTPVEGDDITQKAGVFAFVYGLGFAELSVEGPYWINNGDGERGLGDLTFFAKILLVGKSEKEGMLTVKAEAASTTGDEEKGLGEEDWVYYPSLIFTKAFDPIQIHLQGGYEYVNDGESDTNSWGYGAALDIAFSDNFSIVGEVTGNYNSDANPMVYLIGILVTLNDNIALDAAYSGPLNDDAKEGADKWWNVVAGVTFIF